MLKLNTTKVYADLLKIKIILEFQPVPNPSYIQGKMVDCSTCQDKLETIFLEATQELSDKTCYYNTEKYNVECKKRDLLTNNDKIKKIPTGKEREAASDALLEEEQRKLLALENAINTLKDVIGAIKLIQGNVNRKSADLKVMARMTEQQVGRLSIGSSEEPSMSEMSQNLSELSKLEAEMTVSDIESSSEYVEPDESAGESEVEVINQPTTTDSLNSKEDTNSEIDIGDVLTGESEVEAVKQPTTTDNLNTEPKIASSNEEDVTDVVDSFLTDTSEDIVQDEPEEGSDEVISEDAESEVVGEKQVVAPVAEGKGPVTIRGEVDLDLSELGISVDDDESSKKKSDDVWVFPDKPAGSPEVPPEVKSEKKGTNKKEEKPPVQVDKPAPPTKETKSDVSEIDLDSILDNIRM